MEDLKVGLTAEKTVTVDRDDLAVHVGERRRGSLCNPKTRQFN